MKKKKRKKKKEKKEANNEPKRAINEMQTETREEKNEKNQHMSRIPWQFQCPGVSSFSFVSATVLHSGHTDLAITH